MQHIQQQYPHILVQQSEAAFTMISAASGGFGSVKPGAIFSAVAFTFPNPIPMFFNTFSFWGLGSGFSAPFLLDVFFCSKTPTISICYNAQI